MTNVRLTTEQAQQIEDALFGCRPTVISHENWNDVYKARAIITAAIITAAKAQEQAEQEFTAEQQDRFAAAFDEVFAKAGLPQKQPVQQEPVFISNEQFRSMHFSKVTVYTQNDGKEVIVCTPIRTHIEGFWCEDLTCAKCYTADFRLKHTAPVSIHSESETDSSSSSMRTAIRTKDLTDVEIADIGTNCGTSMWSLMFARAVIAADRELNK